MGAPQYDLPPETYDSATPPPRAHPVGTIGLLVGVFANVVAIIGAFLLTDMLIMASQEVEPTDKEALIIGFIILGIGFFAVVAGIVSIIGIVISGRKLTSIFGLIIAIIAPVSFVCTCVAIAVYLNMTGQI